MRKDMSTYSLKDALMGGPGLDGYAYRGDTYSIEKGRQIIRELWQWRGGKDWSELEFQDSEVLPQPIFFAEGGPA